MSVDCSSSERLSGQNIAYGNTPRLKPRITDVISLRLLNLCNFLASLTRSQWRPKSCLSHSHCVQKLHCDHVERQQVFIDHGNHG